MRLAAIALVASAGAAQADLAGSWCGAGGTLHLDATGIGINEHTICEPSDPAYAPRSGTHPLTCENVYANGEEIVRTDRRELALTLVALPDDRLAVHWGLEPTAPGEVLTRCD